MVRNTGHPWRDETELRDAIAHSLAAEMLERSAAAGMKMFVEGMNPHQRSRTFCLPADCNYRPDFAFFFSRSDASAVIAQQD